MSILEIVLLSSLGLGLIIYITIMLVKFFRKKKNKEVEQEEVEEK